MAKKPVSAGLEAPREEGVAVVENAIEKESSIKFFPAEIRAAACALGLDPFDEGTEMQVRECLESFEYRALRAELSEALETVFTIDWSNRPAKKKLIRLGVDRPQLFPLFEEVFLAVRTKQLVELRKAWLAQTPRKQQSRERLVPETIQRGLEPLINPVVIASEDHEAVKHGHVAELRGADLADRFLADHLFNPQLYRREDPEPAGGYGPNIHLSDLFFALDRDGSQDKSQPGAQNFPSTWSWLGPIVNKIAAFLEVDIQRERPRHPTRIGFTEIWEEKGVLVPARIPEGDKHDRLIDLCQTAWEEGLELRIQIESAERRFKAEGEAFHTDTEALKDKITRLLVEVGRDFPDYTFYKTKGDDDASDGLELHESMKEVKVVIAKAQDELAELEKITGWRSLFGSRERERRSLELKAEIERRKEELKRLIEAQEDITEDKNEEALTRKISSAYTKAVRSIQDRLGLVTEEAFAIRRGYAKRGEVDDDAWIAVIARLKALQDEFESVLKPLKALRQAWTEKNRALNSPDWREITPEQRRSLRNSSHVSEYDEKEAAKKEATAEKSKVPTAKRRKVEKTPKA